MLFETLQHDLDYFSEKFKKGKRRPNKVEKLVELFLYSLKNITAYKTPERI